jgi:cephalosporin hydroxylase
MDRHDIFPHFESCMGMTLREWTMFHNVMHRHYTHYCGYKVLKPPFDWIVMQDILWDTKPPLIIEIGSWEGGFALWMAHMSEAMGFDTTIIGLDITDKPTAVKHPRIQWVIGDATSDAVHKKVAELAGDRRGMVIEDSDHKLSTTRTLMAQYHKYVAPGCYFVVEDTCVEALQLPPNPGPLGAVTEFAAAHPEFTIDRTREKYILTYNPSGYLLRGPKK